MQAEPRLADKIYFLRYHAWPNDLPEEIETHMSWVFLTGDRAYKLKKPVVHDFLDYRTLEARRRDCEAELRLNQPLAPGVYLGLVRLTVDERGALSLDGSGRVVDWMVVMKRLPSRSLLVERIARGDATTSELDTVIDLLVEFYGSTSAAPIEPIDYRRRLAERLDTDVAGLRRHADRLAGHRIDYLGDRLRSLIDELESVGERADRLVDGHGDLRPEHILPGPPAVIIDRLSFDREFRRVDPVFDVALLGIECEHLGARPLAAYLLSGYQRRSDDHVDPTLLDLYEALRATTRARLSITHLDDGVDDTAPWVQRTTGYLAIALEHLDWTGPP